MAQRKNEAVWVGSRRRWQINVQHEGARKTFTDPAPGRKGKIAAERKADKWLDNCLVSENTRVDVMLGRWYEKLKLATSQGHYRQQDSYIRTWIKPAMGARKIGKVTQNDLQSVIDRAYGEKNLSAKTLRNIRACLMAFIKYCRGEKATQLHPETLIIPAGARISVKTIANEAELKTVFSVPTTLYRGKRVEDRFIHAYRFEILTGMRPGELIALKNENINGARVHISESINKYKEVTQGKNRNARRVYTLDKHALKVLADQKRMLIKLGQISPYVFPAKDLGPVREQLLYGRWKKYCEANNIVGATTPYEMRHTFVSVNSGMPDGLKRLVMGHSQNMDTNGIYGHEKAGDMDEAAEYINAAFTKILGW